MTPLLLATAVEAEAAAVRAGLTDATVNTIVVAAVGVGSAAAAATTARLLALSEALGRPFGGVVCAGVGGGFAGRVLVGETVLADRTIAADLGAQTVDGFLPVDELGLGRAVVPTDRGLLAMLSRALPKALIGDVLTVNTVTGTAANAKALADRHPRATVEAMEGYGVACAAASAGLPFAEVRTVSNEVGPRDRAAWRMDGALAALTALATALSR